MPKLFLSVNQCLLAVRILKKTLEVRWGFVEQINYQSATACAARFHVMVLSIILVLSSTNLLLPSKQNLANKLYLINSLPFTLSLGSKDLNCWIKLCGRPIMKYTSATIVYQIKYINRFVFQKSWPILRSCLSNKLWSFNSKRQPTR